MIDIINNPYDLIWASQGALVVKNLPANVADLRDTGSTPGSGRSPGGGHRNPLQYSCLENSTERGAWQAMVHRVAKSMAQLKRLSAHTHTHIHAHTQSERSARINLQSSFI